MASSSITLITTGGTIGSTSKSDSINVSQGQQQLHQHIEELCQRKNVAIKTRAAFNKNSEDLTPADWLTLIKTVADEVDNGSDKIIITHGTDTMAYSAVAIALCFRNKPVKIVLTGSCFTLDHPQSDVSANLIGALASVTENQIKDGVYVSFLNTEKRTQVIDALDIKPMSFDELAFRASFNQPLGIFDEALNNFTTLTNSRPEKTLDLSIDPANIQPGRLQAVGQKIVQLNCYPGMNATQLCAGLTTGCCVIVNLYHSGTGPSLAGANSLSEAIHSRPDLTFLLTPLPSRYISKPYQASSTLIEAGAHLYRDLQPHTLYVLITLCMASGTSQEELLAELMPYQVTTPT